MGSAGTTKKGNDVLLRGSELIIDIQSSSPNALDCLEQYVELLADWQRELADVVGQGNVLEDEDIQLLQSISQQHEAVLEAAKDLKGDFERSLKNLRSWAKGVRAYTDILPKRLSTIKSKKG